GWLGGMVTAAGAAVDRASGAGRRRGAGTPARERRVFPTELEGGAGAVRPGDGAEQRAIAGAIRHPHGPVAGRAKVGLCGQPRRHGVGGGGERDCASAAAERARADGGVSALVAGRRSNRIWGDAGGRGGGGVDGATEGWQRAAADAGRELEEGGGVPTGLVARRQATGGGRERGGGQARAQRDRGGGFGAG